MVCQPNTRARNESQEPRRKQRSMLKHCLSGPMETRISILAALERLVLLKVSIGILVSLKGSSYYSGFH